MTVALALNAPIAGVLSVRSAVALGVFLVAAAVMAWTHIGRDIVATGSDRRAAHDGRAQDRPRSSSAYSLRPACSRRSPACCLSYSLGAASPVALSDVLAPAAAAAIVGGVSVVGGTGPSAGHRRGRAARCAILRSGLSADRRRRPMSTTSSTGFDPPVSSPCSMRRILRAASSHGGSTAPRR